MSDRAGASARKEYERRTAKDEVARQRRDERVRAAHPRVGGLLLRVFSDNTSRQTTTAWKTGAEGEEVVGARLDAWTSDGGGVVLHDRRVPGTKANIDHIAVAPSGVWVIDTKKYANKKVEQVDVGGWLRSQKHLRVGGRDQQRLVDGVKWQMEQVAAVLSRSATEPPAVHGMLCFVDADWSLLARPSMHDGVHVAWQRAGLKLVNQAGPITEEQRQRTAHTLDAVFRPA